MNNMEPLFGPNNTPLQRGAYWIGAGRNRFNGFRGVNETVKSVHCHYRAPHTPLKRGVNETLRQPPFCQDEQSAHKQSDLAGFPFTPRLTLTTSAMRENIHQQH
jgi:hypothetical protein